MACCIDDFACPQAAWHDIAGPADLRELAMSMVRLVEEGAARSGDAADADLRLRYERRAWMWACDTTNLNTS